MQKKTAMVTGANRGLGKAVSLALARTGADVVLVCRDEKRGAAARDEIKAAGGKGNVELLVADLTSNAAVRKAASEFTRRHKSLDVLINNAAVYKKERVVTGDGLETMFAANHLGHFLLTNLLLDALKVAGSARVLTISAPSGTKLDFDDLQGEKRFNAMNAFGASKAATTLFAFALSERLKDTGIASNVVYPGLVKSDLMKAMPAPVRVLLNLISMTPERAAENVVHVATAPELNGVTGRFFKGKKEAKAPASTLNTQAQQELWRVSEKLAGI